MLSMKSSYCLIEQFAVSNTRTFLNIDLQYIYIYIWNEGNKLMTYVYYSHMQRILKGEGAVLLFITQNYPLLVSSAQFFLLSSEYS